MQPEKYIPGTDAIAESGFITEAIADIRVKRNRLYDMLDRLDKRRAELWNRPPINVPEAVPATKVEAPSPSDLRWTLTHELELLDAVFCKVETAVADLTGTPL